MDVIAMLSRVILVVAIITFCVAIISYVIFRVKEHAHKPASAPRNIDLHAAPVNHLAYMPLATLPVEPVNGTPKAIHNELEVPTLANGIVNGYHRPAVTNSIPAVGIATDTTKNGSFDYRPPAVEPIAFAELNGSKTIDRELQLNADILEHAIRVLNESDTTTRNGYQNDYQNQPIIFNGNKPINGFSNGQLNGNFNGHSNGSMNGSVNGHGKPAINGNANGYVNGNSDVNGKSNGHNGNSVEGNGQEIQLTQSQSVFLKSFTNYSSTANSDMSIGHPDAPYSSLKPRFFRVNGQNSNENVYGKGEAPANWK